MSESITAKMFDLTATSIVLGAVFSLICFWFVRRPKNLPPGPWSLPIIGYRFGPGPIHEAYMELFKKYGPIFSLRRGTFLFVVLNDRESIKQALVKSAEFFSDRFVAGQINWGIPDQQKKATIAFSNGKPWEDIRKFSLPALRSFGFGKQSLVPQINHEVRFMADEIRNLKGSPSDLTLLLNKATANVIVQLLFNRRYDYDDVEFNNIIQAFSDMIGLIPDTDPVNVFEYLIHSNKPHYKRYREALYTIKDFMKAHVKSHEETFQENHNRDLIDAFLAHGISKEMKHEDFWRVLSDFFAGGSETTAVVTSWTMVYMAVHPDIQRKVQAELDAVVGRGRQPSTSDRPNLPYCDATLMEVMRIRPVLPISVPHKTSADVTFRGYNIPKDSIIIPHIWAVHHDPNEWKDPEVFNPDRFLSDDGKTVVKNEALMPFGIGRRDCVGSQLAKIETFLLFTNLYQQFEFKFPPDQPTHTLECEIGITMYPKPYKICAIER